MRHQTRAVVAVLAVLGLASQACDRSSPEPTPTPQPVNWSPKPVVGAGDLKMVAQSEGQTLKLHTESGDKTFLAGVNLGSTTPTHQPGELAISTSDYRRWFKQMGELRIPSIRIYTIHPPAFYDELLRYNTEHPQSPLYLIHGVYIPDESYLAEGTLYNDSADVGFSDELRDASAAVHGDLQRAPQLGRSSGTWTSDVSQWVMSWLIGVEWDPGNTEYTDELNADAPLTRGTYFQNTPDASATERWIAKHMDELASHEAARGVSVPIGFANWPTADPLIHPTEPLKDEDLVGVDANHVLPTPNWPGGTFANYHAYPYYPDFLRYTAEYRQTEINGEPDPYAGYLKALKEHHSGMPVIIGELGVPSSLGSAHHGTLGRDQGNHTEADAMKIDADLLRIVESLGLSGAYIFAWTDEWFKLTWNTFEHQYPRNRRQLWHDPLTNEQFFGIIATDPDRIPDAAYEDLPKSGPFKYVLVDADPSYVYFDLNFRGGIPKRLLMSVDTIGGENSDDYRVLVKPAAGTAQVFVREALDPIRLDTPDENYQPDVGKAWHLYRLILNRERTTDGTVVPAEYQDVGDLVEGDWDPSADDYNSLATWQIVTHGEEKDEHTLRLRIPWPMLGLADPSSRTALGEGRPVQQVPIDHLGISFDVDGKTMRLDYTWPTWNHITYKERIKDGVSELKKAFHQLNYR